MNIDDYTMAYIILYRKNFKNKEDFEDLLKFLKLPLNCTRIYIDVNKDSYYGFNRNGKREPK